MADAASEASDAKGRPDEPPHQWREEAGFSQQEIKGMLLAAMERDFPGLDLTESELDELARSAIRIRHSMEALRRLPREQRHRREKARDELQSAMRSFERITGMSVLTFMLKASGEGGVDRD
jgi:hypothetical protein